MVITRVMQAPAEWLAVGALLFATLLKHVRASCAVSRPYPGASNWSSPSHTPDLSGPHCFLHDCPLHGILLQEQKQWCPCVFDEHYMVILLL